MKLHDLSEAGDNADQTLTGRHRKPLTVRELIDFLEGLAMRMNNADPEGTCKKVVDQWHQDTLAMIKRAGGGCLPEVMKGKLKDES